MTHRYFTQPLAIDPYCAAALECFTVGGFHGTSIRQIAAAAELSVPGLYHHYASKSALLEALCDTAMAELLDAMRRADSAGGAVSDRFDRLVSCLIEFHAEFQEVAFVTYSEIRSLPPGPRERHVQARRDVQALVTAVVEEGAAAGVFATRHPRHAARAIANICMGVSQWYRPEGALGVDELVEVYTEVCRDTVGCAR